MELKQTLSILFDSRSSLEKQRLTTIGKNGKIVFKNEKEMPKMITNLYSE
jgi:hypothetical protein